MQRQEGVSSLCEDFSEDGSDTFNDAEVKLGLRDEFGESRKDKAGLGAGDVECDAAAAAVEQTCVLQVGSTYWYTFSSADVLTD